MVYITLVTSIVSIMAASSFDTVMAVPVFKPTFEEMKDFTAYIIKMESQGAHKTGLAKIIPPKEWKPRKRSYNICDIMNLEITDPIEQTFKGTDGVHHWVKSISKKLTVKEFKALCETPKYRTPDYLNYVDLERIYWRSLTDSKPIYGADVQKTLFDDDCNEFNLSRLNTCLNLTDRKLKIPGVTSSYLYFGMWKSTFAWHTEDMDLYSINYLHFGQPKSWYVIPPAYGHAFEKLVAERFPENSEKCPAFFRHKSTLIRTRILEDNGIPCLKAAQLEGEFMVTFPYAYHSGYNHGFNCAEATNFATPRWFEYGKRAKLCKCGHNTVEFSMGPYIQMYQPHLMQKFLLGKDVAAHPETKEIVRVPNYFDEKDFWKKFKDLPFKETGVTLGEEPEYFTEGPFKGSGKEV